MSDQFTTLKTDIQRDRWGRPLITPPNGGAPQPYVRVSTLAKVLDDKTALTRWKQRMVATGIGMRPDLAHLASTARGDNKQLDQVINEAMAAAQTTRAANIGTTLHRLTENIDSGVMTEHIPGELIDDLYAYELAMRDIKVLAIEKFVVIDELQAAGTFDRLIQLPDGRVMVADIKTGQHEPNYPHSATTQIAIYSRGHLYDPEHGRMGDLPNLGVDQNHGMLIHLPAGTGTCDLYLLDLAIGWQLAQTATAVKAVFKAKPISKYSTK